MLINDIEDFVKDFNENIKVIYVKRKEVDYKYPFAISDKMLENGENFTCKDVWGGLKNLSYYCMNVVRDLGYQGFKLVFDGYYSDECPEENGAYKFHLECSDRRIE